MRIFRSPEEVLAQPGAPASFGPSVVTIGNFDGVHAGHRWIIRRVAEMALAEGLTSVVMTFDPHPARVLAPDRAPRLMMTVDQRLRGFEAEGIETVLILPFSLEFARLTPEEFAVGILAGALKARHVLVGEDFRFGYKQAGDVDTLRRLGAQLGFDVFPVAPIAGGGERISSTRIRKLLTEGAVSRACRLLGAPFALEGNVVKGQGIGSKRTVPTLNMAPLNETLPKNGVYVTRTRDLHSDRRWNSITNIGYRPTFEGKGLSVETFLLDPLTGEPPERIEVAFLKFVRDERKFETPELLKSRILQDAGVAMRLHRRLEKLNVR